MNSLMSLGINAMQSNMTMLGCYYGYNKHALTQSNNLAYLNILGEAVI